MRNRNIAKLTLSFFWRNWSNFATAQTCGIRAGCAHHEKASAAKLALAEVPKVDHRVRQRFECVVDFADEFESKQQALELVFPGKHAFDGAEALFKNIVVKDLFAPALGGFSATRIFVDIGRHAAIEDSFPIQPAIVDAIQADDAAAQVKTHGPGDAR